MQNGMCGTTVIGCDVTPRDRSHSAFHHTPCVECTEVKCILKCGKSRAADVDVVPAPDADVEPGASLTQQQQASPHGVSIDTDICHACDLREPPPRRNSKRRGPVKWLKCVHAGITRCAW